MVSVEEEARVWPDRRLWPDWHELWRYRTLGWLLLRRELVARYSGSFLGAAWGLLRVLMSLAMLCLVFGVVGQLNTGGPPYPLFVLSGLLIWELISQTVLRAGSCLLAARELMGKCAFPRLFFPLAALGAVVVETAVMTAALPLLMLAYGVAPAATLWRLPLYLALSLGLALGLALWASALSLRFRDLGHGLPYLLQFGMLLSPVGYAANLVPPQWSHLYALNPVVALIEGCRSSVLGTAPPTALQLAISLTLTVTILISGLLYYHRSARRFSEYV